MIRGLKAKQGALLLMGLFLMAGCTQGSLFAPDFSEDEPEASVSTVVSGSVLATGDSIPISLSEERAGDYTSLEIRVLLPEGTEVYSTVYDGAVLSEPLLPDLQLPSLEEGTYIVELLLYEQQEQVAREQSLFFLTDATFTIHGITLYPPTSETDALVIAEANISSSDPELDPYLRWRFEGDLLSEGKVSENGTTTRIASGTETGVFALTAELFPWAPPENSSIELSPPRTHSTDVVVRRNGDSGSHQESVYVSYGFNGHSRAAGVALSVSPEDGAFDWRSEGEPVLTLQDELFGYQLEGGSGFSLSRSLLPVSGETLYPFEVNISFAPLSIPSSGTDLFRTGDGVRELVLGLSGNGEPWVWLRGEQEGSGVQAPSIGVVSGESTTLQVEILPFREETQVSFFAGGVLLHEELVPVDLTGSGMQGETGTPAVDSVDAADSYDETTPSSGEIAESPSEGASEGNGFDEDEAGETSVDVTEPSGQEETFFFERYLFENGNQVQDTPLNGSRLRAGAPGAVFVIEELSVALTSDEGRDAFGSDSSGEPEDSNRGDSDFSWRRDRSGDRSDQPDDLFGDDPVDAESSTLDDAADETTSGGTISDETTSDDAPEEESRDSFEHAERTENQADDDVESVEKSRDRGDSEETGEPETSSGAGDEELGDSEVSGSTRTAPDNDTDATEDPSGSSETSDSEEQPGVPYELEPGEERRLPISEEAGVAVRFFIDSTAPGAGAFLLSESDGEFQEIAYIPAGLELSIESDENGHAYTIDDAEPEPLPGERFHLRNPYSGSLITVTRQPTEN